MEELGELLGVLTAVCYFAAVSDYFWKLVLRLWVSRLPKDSALKTGYMSLMRFALKYHRWFGVAAGILAPVHLLVQITNGKYSLTGIIAASLMAVTVILGILIAWGRRPKIVKIHRSLAFSVLAMVVIHLILEG